MRAVVYPISCSFLVILGCYGADADPSLLAPSLPCPGLQVQIIDQAVTPPANVATIARVTDCEGRSLGRRLSIDAFEIVEDGEALSSSEATRLIAPVEREMASLTLIALDLSGSIHGTEQAEEMILQARDLVEGIGPEQQVAIYGFDGRAELLPFSYFTEDRAELGEALDQAAKSELVDPSTNLNGAVLGGLEVLDDAVAALRRDESRIVHGSLVVFTDGRDLASRVLDSVVERAVEHTEHSVFAIGVGEAIDATTLRMIGKTQGMKTMDRDAILAAFERVSEEVQALAQRDYLISYCTPARAGTHTFEIAVGHEELRGTATLDFLADGFGSGCSPETSPLGF